MAIANYENIKRAIETANPNNQTTQTPEQQFQQETEEAAVRASNAVSEYINKDTNSFVTAEVNGRQVTIIEGNPFDANGDIDVQNLDRQIVFIDENGQRQIATARQIGEVFENIPSEQVTQQAINVATAPIKAKFDNEQTRIYEVNEDVRLQNGQIGLITEVLNGKYMFQDQLGNIAEIEPRSIVNEDNIKDIEKGEVVHATLNGQHVQGEYDINNELRQQGLASVGSK